MNLFIGLTGRAHSGKDLAATMLSNHCFAAHLPMHRFAFAQAMRAALRAFGVPDPYITDPALKNEPIPCFGTSYRELMQELGDMGRRIQPDFWVRRVATRIAELPAGDSVIVITDVRYPNEADWIRANGGAIVAIERDGTPEVRAHSSEEHFDELQPEHRISNNGTTAELEAKLAALLVNLDAALQAKQAEVAA